MAAVAERQGWSTTRRFYAGMTMAILATVLLGFSRTFFLKPWFPEAASLAAPEPFFYVHGAFFAAWFVLLPVQSFLVGAGRIDLHRRLGQLGAVLAVIMVGLGIVASLVAARRPTGFVGISEPPLQFLVVPFSGIGFFGLFVALAMMKRRDGQSHKRYMLLGSISLAEAAVVRWPFAMIGAASPLPFFSTTELLLDLFLVPMVVWDLASRGRLHPVTLWGGLGLIASQPLRLPLSQTGAWLAFAGWATRLLG